MKKLLFILFITGSLLAESKYPADISYMVADIKYSKEHGVKICEVQHGIMSTFHGDLYLNPKRGTIPDKVAAVFAEFDMKKWMCGSNIAFSALQSAFERSGNWTNRSSFTSIKNNADFQLAAKAAPIDESLISSYSAMLFMNPNEEFTPSDYPGILFIDRATHPFWSDKYLMSLLFRRSNALSKIKPEWNLYQKEYRSDLAATIVQDLGGDAFVIKPRGAFLGNGVIISSKDELDDVLKAILKDPQSLKKHKDKSYNHWSRDTFDSFIVERYYPSDPIVHENKRYEPSMRLAFVCIYDNKEIDFRFLGGYWMLPTKSLEEEGTLNELKKAYCKVPYFVKATDEELSLIEDELQATIPLLYREMLTF